MQILKPPKNEAENPRKYKVLIIGAGGQGYSADMPESSNQHKIISFGHAFSIHSGFELLGFVDKDENKAFKAAKTWGAERFHSRIWGDNFDVIVIATNDDCHYKLLLEAMAYTPKLVICEKPICTDLDEAREIVQLYKERGIPLMVNYTRRFTPRYRELKRFYDIGLYGKAIEAKLLFNRGWLHTATHGIDTFNWIIGKSTGNIIQYSMQIPDIPRRWILQIEFENYTWTEQRIDNEPVNSMFDYSMWYLAQNAYDFLEGKDKLWCTGEDALKALEICYKIMPEGAK